MEGNRRRRRSFAAACLPWAIAIAAALLVSLGVTSQGRAWQLEVSRVQAASAILIDPSSGRVLYEQNADAPRAPASIAKIMLELVVLERVQAGHLSIDEPITVSAWASKIGGSQVYLAEGESFTLGELLKAIVVASANDACVAVAEHVAGSADGFVDLMNQRAREMGLSQTRFINVHGLDDEPGEGNVTSARDIATIACHLVEMPHVLEMSSIVEEMFRQEPKPFKLQNTNKLLGQFDGLDGLKTGYTTKAGFCLCATAERKGMRLISVVLGADSNKHRFSETARLLGAGFAQLQRKTLVAEGSPVAGGVAIRGGRKQVAEAIAGRDLSITLPLRSNAPVPVVIPRKGLRAPIAKGDTLGDLEVKLDDGAAVRAPILAAAAVGRATVFQRIARMFGGGS